MKVQVLKEVDPHNLSNHIEMDFPVYYATLGTSGKVVEVFLSKQDSDFEYKLNLSEGSATYNHESDSIEFPAIDTWEIESLRQIIEIEV